ncbi:type II secretion system GspH family protein [Campylobacter sp. VBCF_05 NA6]|uniref:type II secretion system protein n=1 Tax=unclassified Campylobacter TaxID=2593542 RepID=UPI0022E9D47F|nr:MULTISPECIES: type II secretion system protein [unclassified Campylobacter]MDA3057759.1 type II secretion system GspH family protein [Campylobacter sp. VBCF_04 NA7]MDA3058867.1 type II secretion system GspH family protein [Campylobacter sp. VBCF_05 NA6]
MRKGFTMIELIFVIVILGILAAVAIPRLAATRDDAEIAKAASNISTALSEVTAYYTARGEFNATNYDQMSNALDQDGKFKVKGKDCAKFTVDNTNKKVDVNVSGCAGLENGIKNALPSGTIGSHEVGGNSVNFSAN